MSIQIQNYFKNKKLISQAIFFLLILKFLFYRALIKSNTLSTLQKKLKCFRFVICVVSPMKVLPFHMADDIILLSI